MRPGWRWNLEFVLSGRGWVITVATAAALSGCMGDAPEVSDAVVVEVSDAVAPTDTVEGLLRVGENGMTFRTCGSAVEAWVVEAGGADLRQAAAGLSVDAGGPVLARFIGTTLDPPAVGPGSDYERAVYVSRWVFLAEDTAGCPPAGTDGPDGAIEAPAEGALPPLPEGVLLRALGNEPFWNVEIRPSVARVTRLGYEDLEFPIEESTPDGPTRTWAGGTGEHRFTLSVDERSCPDTMADRTYRFEAQLTLDGQPFRGCAYERLDADSGGPG